MPRAHVELTTRVWPMMKSAAGTNVAYGLGRMGEWGWSRSAWWYLFVWDRSWLVNYMWGRDGKREAGKRQEWERREKKTNKLSLTIPAEKIIKARK